MRFANCLSLVLAFALGAIAPAAAAPTCLYTYQIDRTKVVDAKTIDFRMRDGTVYRNVLQRSCTSLPFNGFVYTVRVDQICDNLQSIRVLQSHEVCLLGKFTKMPGAKVDVGH
jgi:hypothetical protein